MARTGKPKKTVIKGRKSGKIDYRSAKKLLNKYHKFTFTAPRKPRDFSPQQKAAITRKFLELESFIRAINRNRSSFIPYKKGSERELKRLGNKATNKGVFFPRPNAVLRKRKGKWIITSQYLEREDIFIPLPDRLYSNPGLIPAWLESQYEKYYPAQMSISVMGHRGSFGFTPELGVQYFYNAFEFFGGKGEHKNALNGIYITAFTPEEFEKLYT